jgi:hypothetical protein
MVVHLRRGDNHRDERRGLDDASLEVLGEHINKESSTPPYLVTNNVEWYAYFQDKYGWRHPQWERVTHSVYSNIVSGAKSKIQQKGRLPQHQLQKMNSNSNNNYTNPRTRRILEMWSDWYTCLKAETVYHTFSDFSASAVHWKDPQSQASRVIRGLNDTTQQLDLVEEWWRHSPLALPLRERKLQC